MTLVTFGKSIRQAAIAAAVFASGSCAGDIGTASKSPSYLVIELLQGASGASANAQFNSVLNSDVQTIVNVTVGGSQTRVPTIFADTGRVQLRMGLKKPGPTDSPTEPSTLNHITVTRYRIEYKRADGRNTPGVDVPYSIDGGATITMGFSSVTLVFDMVKHTSKLEPPLINLVGGGGANQINTIATVTFYGHDQHGNAVSASGMISINFGDFADPSS